MRNCLGTMVLLIAAMSGAGFAQSAGMDAAQSSVAASARPSREQAVKLLAAMGIRQQVEATVNAKEKAVKAAARSCYKDMNPGADDATIQQLDASFDAAPLIVFEDVAEPAIELIQKTLTAGEVQSGIDFYSSEAGKHLRAQIPAILLQARPISGKMLNEKMEQYTLELNRRLKDFQGQHKKPEPVLPKSST